MGEFRPLGKVKSLRIPAGKEGEYTEDVQGEPIHTTYGTDEHLPGTVLPTGKHFRVGGGSFGFGVNDLDIPQNIIACDEQGQQTITQVTRRQMMRTASRGSEPLPSKEELNNRQAMPVEEIRKLASFSEAQFLAAAAAPAEPLAKPLPVSLRSEMLDPFEEGVDMAMKKANQPKSRKKGGKPRRGVASVATASVQPPEQAETSHSAAKVLINGPFGQVELTCSGIFRDGIYLVLFTDQRQLSTVYKLPPVEEPMELTVKYGNHIVTCLWAGISFTMPSGQVTFTILLVAAEEGVDSGTPGAEMGLDNPLAGL